MSRHSLWSNVADPALIPTLDSLQVFAHGKRNGERPRRRRRHNCGGSIPPMLLLHQLPQLSGRLWATQSFPGVRVMAATANLGVPQARDLPCYCHSMVQSIHQHRHKIIAKHYDVCTPQIPQYLHILLYSSLLYIVASFTQYAFYRSVILAFNPAVLSWRTPYPPFASLTSCIPHSWIC